MCLMFNENKFNSTEPRTENENIKKIKQTATAFTTNSFIVQFQHKKCFSELII